MPAAIGALILGGLPGIAGLGSLAGATLFGVSLASIVGSVVIAGVLIGLQLVLAKGMPKQEDGSQPLRQSIPPRNGGYGRARPQPYYMLYEQVDGVSYDVLALVSGKIGGFVAYYLHDDVVEVDGDGIVQELDEDQYGDEKLRLFTRIGLDTETAYSEFTAELSASTVWTAAHRGDGIASLALICESVDAKDFQKIYPHGLPQPSAVLDLYPVWDGRVTSSPTHDRDNPDTWEVSENPVLQIIDYLTHADHGMGLSYEDMIEPAIADWLAEADLCDELVNTKSGNEKRYTSNGWYTFDTKPEDVLGSLLSTCDGWMAEDADGVLRIHVGVYREPEDRLTIREQHVLAYTVNHGIADEERINELAISFISPVHKYKDVQCDPWRDEDDISESGRVRSQQLSLQWVQRHTQGRRLAKRAMVRLASPLRGSMTLTLFGLALLAKRWAKVELPGVSGLESGVIEIQNGRVDLLNGRVQFEWILIDPDTIDDWDPATEEGEAPPVPVELGRSLLPEPENVEAVAVGDHIDVSWDDDPDGRNDILWTVRYRLTFDPDLSGPGQWVDSVFANLVPTGGRFTASIFPTTEDAFDVQVAALAPLGTTGDYVPEPPLAVTTDTSALYDNEGLLLLDNAGPYISDNS